MSEVKQSMGIRGHRQIDISISIYGHKRDLMKTHMVEKLDLAIVFEKWLSV